MNSIFGIMAIYVIDRIIGRSFSIDYSILYVFAYFFLLQIDSSTAQESTPITQADTTPAKPSVIVWWWFLLAAFFVIMIAIGIGCWYIFKYGKKKIDKKTLARGGHDSNWSSVATTYTRQTTATMTMTECGDQTKLKTRAPSNILQDPKNKSAALHGWMCVLPSKNEKKINSPLKKISKKQTIKNAKILPMKHFK